MRFLRMTSSVGYAILTALLGCSVACSDDEGSRATEDSLTSESCSGTKLDAHGICRKSNGQFAKKVCCECSGTGSPAWTSGDIVAPSVGLQGSPIVRLDGQGRPRVVYWKYTSGDNFNPGGELWYATLTNGAWQSEKITSGSVIDGQYDFVLDGADVPHVVLGQRIKFSSYVRHWSRSANGTWTKEDVDTLLINFSTGERIGVAPVMAIGPDGALHASYRHAYEGSSEDVIHAVRGANKWEKSVVTTVLGPLATAKRGAIGVTASGTVHVTFPAKEIADDGWPEEVAKHARTQSGGGWAIDAAPTAETVVFDSNGSLHTLHCNATGDLVYEHGTSEPYTLDIIAKNPAAGAPPWACGSTAIALDGHGDPHVAFRRASPPSDAGLWYGVRRNDTWALVLADQGALLGSGKDPSIAVADQCGGDVHLVHVDYEQLNVRYTTGVAKK